MPLEIVSSYIENNTLEFSKPICQSLREIFLSEGLIEEFKWKMPCYSHHGLVCSMGAFKKDVAIWFIEGALLSDERKILQKAQEKTKAMRSLRYKTLGDLDEKVLRSYVKEAMLINEMGLKTPKAPSSRSLIIPEDFEKKLASNQKASMTFHEFPFYKRREFIDWITEAKRPETRENRIEKSLNMLEEGKGKNDKYRS